MKRVVLVSLLFISSFSFGQGLNTELGFNTTYSQTVTGLAISDEYTFIVKEQRTASSNITESTLLKIDTLGVSVVEAPILPGYAEIVAVDGLIASQEGGTFITGSVVPCALAGLCHSYFQMLDEEGNSEFNLLLANDDCVTQHLTGLSYSSLGMVLMNYSTLGTAKIYLFNPADDALENIDIEHKFLKGFDQFSSAQIVGYKENEAYVYDATGTTISTTSFGSDLRDLAIKNDTLFALTTDSLFLYDDSMTLLLGTTIPGYTDYTNLKLGDEVIQLISQTATEQHIITYNYLLGSFSTQTLSVALNNPHLKDYSDTHFSAGINFPLVVDTAIRYLDFSLLDATDADVNRTDAAIIDLQIDDIEVVPAGPDFNLVNVSASVLVKNNDFNVLDLCQLNHALDLGTTTCNPHFFTQLSTGLFIMPGESTWVTLGWTGQQTVPINADGTSEFDFCVFSSYPNMLTDLNVSNDEYCETISGVVGLMDESKTVLTLYPNPTTDQLFIKNLPQEFTSYKIYNTVGELVQSSKIDGNKLSVNELTNGMYIISFESSRSASIIHSFVKK